MDQSQVSTIASLLRALDPADIENVIAEFDPRWQQTIRDSIGQPTRSMTNERPLIDGVPRLLDMMEAATHGTVANSRSPSQDGSVCHGSSRGDLFAVISDDQIVAALQREHPQTSALCLATLAPERAASLLGRLDELERVDLLKRLRDLVPIEDETLISAVCEEMVASISESEPHEPDGIGKARAILERIPADLRGELWTSLSNESQDSVGAECEDLCTDFLQALELDASLASLEFSRVFNDQWPMLDPLIECFSPETLYRASQGLDLGARQTFFSRLPDGLRLQVDLVAANEEPVVISQIHRAQVTILKRALTSGHYQLAVWQRKKHISVSA